MRAQTGQVDQETLGKYQSETNRLAAAEAEVASIAANLKQAQHDYDRAVDLHAQKWLSQQAMERARTDLPAGAGEPSQGARRRRGGARHALGRGRQPQAGRR